jgi:hypothetical protein
MKCFLNPKNWSQESNQKLHHLKIKKIKTKIEGSFSNQELGGTFSSS